MKYGTVYVALAAVVLIGAGLVTSAFGQVRDEAQQQGGDRRERMTMPPPPPPLTVRYVGDSLLVLRGNTLVKLDEHTLEESGSVMLGEERADMQDGQRILPRPLGGPPLLIADGAGRSAAVLVILGDTFYRVQPRTMTVVATTALPALPLPPMRREDRGEQRGVPPADMEPAALPGMGAHGNGPGGHGMGPGMPPTTYELQGNTLYLVRGPQLMAIDVNSGKILAEQSLAPTPPENLERQGQQK
jgi:hypothetical protein